MKNWPIIISRILDPFPYLLFAMAIVIHNLSLHSFGVNFAVLLVAFVLFIVYFIYLLKTGQIADYDLKERTDRYVVYKFSILLVLTIGLTYFLLNELALFIFILGMLGFILIFYVISRKWKISFHAAIQAYFMAVMVHFYGVNWWWWSLVVIAISWARVKGKFHTPAQVAVGSVLGYVLTALNLLF